MTQTSYLQTIVDNTQPVPDGEDSYYADLTARNRHFITPQVQKKIRDLKILVAGCGAGGGACLEPLARLGVTHFRLADVGSYELTNMNRQHTFVDCVGMKKAAFHERELKRINPHMDIVAYTDGINEQNMPGLVQWADMIFDCVDVTTQSAILQKLNLHEFAKKEKKPVFAMLDLGFCQWGKGYDYRRSSVQTLDGRLARARAQSNPIKILVEMFSLGVFPAHTLHLVLDLLKNPTMSASQLGCAADLLAAISAAAVVRFATDDKFIEGWDMSLERLAIPLKQRISYWLRAPRTRMEINQLLRTKEGGQ
jgi:hypothetical protein